MHIHVKRTCQSGHHNSQHDLKIILLRNKKVQKILFLKKAAYLTNQTIVSNIIVNPLIYSSVLNKVWSVYQVINTRGGRDDAEHEATFGKSEKNLARIGK